MIEINGMAHVHIAVSQWQACREFYQALLPFLGLKPVFEGADMIYYVGGRTGFAVGRCDDKYAGERFAQNSVGLHHVCFRARNRADVDQVHTFLQKIMASVVHAPEDGPWAPGYYSVLFEDPVGTRLEVNHVPGKGIFATGVEFEPAGDYS